MSLLMRTRRKRYLELKPSYLSPSEDSSLELAEPLLFDSLVRKFQTAQEREAEKRRKGFSGVLETDLIRGEARLEQLRSKQGTNAEHPAREAGLKEEKAIVTKGGQHDTSASSKQFSIESIDNAWYEEALTREEALETWQDIMAQRFVAGKDQDFDYATVDNDEKYDDLTARQARQDAEEKWFDEEDEEVIDDGEHDQSSERTGINGIVPRKLEGETGIQDF